ncbi:uncharacterized protein LOC126379751 [Pectinophora gossypiella]|uniref:uncharacterized protein LOC126379751 n=1 Tax=Pectinophora gossypiella TaxID=13191 RepID=UPI00214EF982|nr:uncharacterized protein LOC126379751 [Pectinophora gossypiella]
MQGMLEYIKIYTDGSKTQNRTSFAYYNSFCKIGKVFECNNLMSIFSAEILAIIYAVNSILINSWNSNKFLILSDSMSSLQAVSKKCLNASMNYLVYELRKAVKNVYNAGLTIEFCWVPGHSGILGNELVDTLAKSTENVSLCDFKVPQSDLVIFLKNNMIKRWSLYLEASRQIKGKWLADIAPEPSTKAWFERGSLFLGRHFISAICRLRIGHCKFPSHLNRLKLNNTAACTYCNNSVICDLDHIMFVCSKFNLQRLLFIGLSHH